MRQDETPRRERRRLLTFLGGGPARLVEAEGGRHRLERDGASVALDATLLASLAEHGLVARAGASVALTPTGEALARRLAATGDPFQEQHRNLEPVEIDLGAGRQAAIANACESPLRQLATRRARNGAPFLSRTEFEAGERLRSDYTRGQIMPRLGANWEASVASARRSGGAADISDTALAARQRVDAAIAAVGPELAGMLIDICCFLKGLEQVEIERGWPARSAKVVLKQALAALARHYDPGRAGKSATHRMLHWGTEDYRPRI